MLDPHINTVLNAFIILLKGDKKILGDIELIPFDYVLQWVSARVTDLPLEVRSAIVHDLKEKPQVCHLLKKTVNDSTLTPDIYRCVAATAFKYAQKKDFSTMRVDEEWVRMFVFLYNLSKQLPEGHIDHHILYSNYSNEFLEHFKENFEFIWEEGERYRAQIFNFYYILHIYEEFNIYNWRFFPTINQLIDLRFKQIIKVNPASGKTTYVNPLSLFS
jgi:hypothetical protein